jgi:hypothetical protein
MTAYEGSDLVGFERYTPYLVLCTCNTPYRLMHLSRKHSELSLLRASLVQMCDGWFWTVALDSCIKSISTNYSGQYSVANGERSMNVFSSPGGRAPYNIAF